MLTNFDLQALRQVFDTEESRPNRHVVLFSGGQDSTTALLLARQLVLDFGGNVVALSVNYKQRHSIELACAARVALFSLVRQIDLDCAALAQLGDSALFDPEAMRARAAKSLETPLQQIGMMHVGDTSLPSSFVPGRNSLLLSLAAAVAFKRGARYIWIGANQFDSSGYPDCRREYLEAKEQELRLALAKPDLTIVAPFLHISKAMTFEIAEELGALELVLEETHTCYRGDRSQRHAWGYGCAACPACVLRRNGFEDFQAKKRREGTAR